jgi:CopG antitoxin of type II toxin-antitoxin system
MPKLKRVRKIPTFRSETAERTFWETHDSADSVDWSAAQLAVFPNVKPFDGNDFAEATRGSPR